MRFTAFLLLLALGACTPAQDQRAREEADQAKRDAKVALQKAEVETKKLSKEVDADMDKARTKVRKAFDEPADKKTHQ